MIDLSNYNALSALIVMLALLFCAYVTTRRFLRVSVPVLLLDCVVFCLACVLAMPLIHRYTFLRDHRALIFFFALYYPIFNFSVELNWVRSLVIFLWATVLLIFPSNMLCLLEIAIHPEHTAMSFGADILFLQLYLTVFLCAAVWFLTGKCDSKIFLPSYTPDSLWVTWLSIPILFLGLNIALLPEYYEQLHSSQLYWTYLFFSGSLFVLFLYLTSIFYSHMMEYVRIQQYKEAQRLSDIQSLQFKNLQAQIEADRHARHDFKHTLHLLSQLAANGDTQGLRSYIREYTKEISGSTVKNYCQNPAINALLNYYENKAAEEGVLTNIQVDLSRPLPLSDPEICSLLGNIMENGIDAAKAAPVPARHFSISIRIQNDTTLYIVSSNDFDGELIPDTTRKFPSFSSKMQKNHGIGLQSIRETVDKYSGTLRISNNPTEFFLDIAIRI